MQATGHFDWLGALVAALAVGGLSFGLIRGEAKEWQDPVAWAAIVIGVIALIAFPFLMARRPDPLVPLSLFRSRAFTSINLATFFIYGALYVTFLYQALVLQGVLGYTALAAGAVGIPSGLMLSLLSTRIGTVAGRTGARPFLVAGPTIMALGLLWWARLPADSAPWLATHLGPGDAHPAAQRLHRRPAGDPALRGRDLVRRGAAHDDADGIGVGPLLGRRLGHQQLDLAGRVAVDGRHHLHRRQRHVLQRPGLPRCPSLDVSAPDVRSMFQPLNPPPAGATAAEMLAQRQASIDAFHVAALINAGLLVVGAAISFVGLRERATPAAPDAPRPIRRRRPAAPASPASRADDRCPMTREWDARTYDRVADPMTRWGNAVLDRPAADRRRARPGRGLRHGPRHRGPARAPARTARSSPSTGRRRWWTSARDRLARFGDRVSYVVADLGSPIPLDEPVDAVLSTATFHWVPDHDALFANLAAVLRHGGWLVAQCGGVGNIANVQARARDDRRRLARVRSTSRRRWRRRRASMRPASSTSNAG